MCAMLKSILASLTIVIGLAACTTPQPPPPPPVAAAPASSELADKIVAANAVYFARVERADGLARYIISEVWRHDPALGPAPAIGSEWAGIVPLQASKVYGDAVIIYIAPSHMGHAGHTTGTVPVTNGYLVRDHTPVAELRDHVVSSHAALKIEPSSRPSLDVLVSRANAVYLARVDRSGGLVHYIVTEVWRSGPDMGTPLAIGSEFFEDRSNIARKDQPTMTYGDHVVIFDFRPSLEIPGGRELCDMPAVFNGYLPMYHMSLDALHAMVAASTHQADPN